MMSCEPVISCAVRSRPPATLSARTSRRVPPSSSRRRRSAELCTGTPDALVGDLDVDTPDFGVVHLSEIRRVADQPFVGRGAVERDEHDLSLTALGDVVGGPGDRGGIGDGFVEPELGELRAQARFANWK